MSPPVNAPGDATDAAQRDRTLRWLRRGVWLVLALGVLAFLVRGADNPPDPVLVPAGEAQARLSPASSWPPSSPVEAFPPSSAPTSPTTAAGVGRPSTTSAAAAEPSGPAPSPTSSPPPPSPPTVPPRRPLPGFDDVAFRVTSAGGGNFDGVAMLADTTATHSQGLMEQRDLRGYDGMVFRFSAPSTGEFYMRNTRIPLSIAYFDAGGRFVSSTDMTPCPDSLRTCPTYPAAAPYLHAIEVALGDLGRLGAGPGSVLSFPSP